MTRHNLGTVIRFEVVRTLSKRRFWIATLAVPILLVIVFLLVFVSSSASDKAAEEQKYAQFSFEYTDASGLVDSTVVATLDGQKITDPAAGVAAVKDGTVEAFFDYPAEIRKVIYTTNAIESVNMSLRKVTKNRGSFPNDDALIKLYYLALRNISKKWTMPIQNWKAALNRFTIMFDERMPQH